MLWQLILIPNIFNKFVNHGIYCITSCLEQLWRNLIITCWFVNLQTFTKDFKRKMNRFICYIKVIFTLQKRTVIFLVGVKSRNSCRNLFMRLETLPLPCEYTFTRTNFVVNNQEHFQTNSAIQSVNSRKRGHLHRPTSQPFMFSKKVRTMLASKSSTVYHEMWQVLWLKWHNLKQH
jgi:IS1 family transposase